MLRLPAKLYITLSHAQNKGFWAKCQGGKISIKHKAGRVFQAEAIRIYDKVHSAEEAGCLVAPVAEAYLTFADNVSSEDGEAQDTIIFAKEAAATCIYWNVL